MDGPGAAAEEDAGSWPKNETPGVITEGIGTVIQFLQTYGWFIVFGVIAALFLKSKLNPALEARKKRKEQEEYNAKYSDVGTIQKRQETMETHRRRLQEQHDVAAARFAEDQKKREEEKRQEKIDDWDKHQRGGGYRSKYKPAEEETRSGTKLKPKSKPLAKPDYNPLMGAGGGSGGSGYRPSRRAGGGGGG